MLFEPTSPATDIRWSFGYTLHLHGRTGSTDVQSPAVSSGSSAISRSDDELTHGQFLISAGIFEGGLLLIAFVAGWVTGTNPTLWLQWRSEDFVLGLAATLPMLALLAICMLSRSSGMLQIRKFLRETIGVFLARCRLIDLILLALLAGVCEEIFFRGFLYAWVSAWNPVLAVMLTNLLFGLAHAVTPVYAMLAAFLGLYLTALVASDSTPNLLIPITAHTLYDLVAFYVIIRDCRRHEQQSADTAANEQ
jgi:membrane protease YdiL (CAAX protease family)